MAEVHEACGVVGVAGLPGAARHVARALLALQHRGQESAGVASVDLDGRLHLHKGMGLVHEALAQVSWPEGSLAIGHVRYSTTGATTLENAQPIRFHSRFGELALCHNGNFVNGWTVRAALAREGAVFQTTTDTEVVAHLLARSTAKTLLDALREALAVLYGGYALLLLAQDMVIGVRDPEGIRPLVLGRAGSAFLLMSESCATTGFPAAQALGDVLPGELVVLRPDGVLRQPGFISGRGTGLCAFEWIYFARPDSRFEGETVQLVRRRLGRELWHEAPAAGDLVVGVPDSSLPAAEGYAEAGGLPFVAGLAKNRYVGRTFIEPLPEDREQALRLKLAAIPDVVRGKRVVLVDDSLVRGTTARYLVRELRAAGAREVHLRIASPPYRFPCHYGIDTSNREDLIAAHQGVPELGRALGADSLAFLSPAGARRAIGRPGCMACFTGEYPVPVEEAHGKYETEVPR